MTIKKIKRNRGMTYVELIVVLGIFAVMSTIVIFNYGEFQAKVDIKNLASDIALKIVQAQKSAMNGVLPVNQSLPTDWKPAYGVFFNLVGNDIDGIANNKKFIYFVDSSVIEGYIGGEELDTVSITKNNFISKIEVCADASCTPPTQTLDTLSITFTRPNSGPFFTGPTPALIGSQFVQIKIQSPKKAFALIKIYPSGRVQVN